ncbi:PLC-like phosphodiesterase [Jackrogersella minutella]|nr:PLC-like phosphodiesterase [Jackrogersella minutella]
MRGLSLSLRCLAATIAASLAAADSTALGQFALQKVLRDGRDVFGDAPGNESAYPHANWMASIPDDTPLAQLSIPGTHDAATWNYTQATQDALADATRCDGTTPAAPQTYRCQRRSIADALEAGVRFFDLRFATDPLGRRLVFWHGPALMSATSGVEDVMVALWDWLEEHDGEVALVSLQYEGGTREGAAFDGKAQGLLRDIFTSEAAARYVWQGRGYLPTLGEARGKVVLIRRFDLDGQELPGVHLSPAKWPDNNPAGFALVYNESSSATAFIEDYYEPDNSTVPDNIAAKTDAAAANLRKAAAGDKEALFITFTSAEHNTNTPPVYPQTMALGNGTDVTPNGGVNHQLVSVLEDFRGSRLGIVVVDFFDEPAELVGLILGV